MPVVYGSKGAVRGIRIWSSSEEVQMITKEMVRTEIDQLNEEQLQVLYRFVKDLAKQPAERKDESLLARLRRIQFDGPEDLASNHDLYVSGEKSAR